MIYRNAKIKIYFNVNIEWRQYVKNKNKTVSFITGCRRLKYWLMSFQ